MSASTPWLDACGNVELALELLEDIHRKTLRQRREAIEEACEALRQAESCILKLVEQPPADVPEHALSMTLARFRRAAWNVWGAATTGVLVRPVDLRDLIRESHQGLYQQEQLLRQRAA
jgi:hypothetical protein